MTYTISNAFLSVSIDSLGAQLRSVRSASGTEYLWQGDDRYWADSSPLLFPYIARLYEGSYSYRGERYRMGIHGFAAACEFAAADVSGESLCLVLTENEDTLAQYPFRFKLSVTYTLSGPCLRVDYRVCNCDSKLIPFAIGGHPGFNVPFAGATEFEDYYLRFGEACRPLRVGFTGELFLSGEDSPYALEEDTTLRLSHRLFDEDAIILKNTAKSVTLACDKSSAKITVDFPGFDYFGIWHAPCSDAPYVCLEPWTSLPSRQGIIEELCEKKDMLMLEAGEIRELQWTVSITEG